MEAEDWLAYYEQDRSPPAVELGPTLKDYMLGRLTAQAAAEKLSAMVAADDVDLESALDDLWAYINNAAQKLTAAHDRLIDLIAALRELPDLVRDGEPVDIWEMTVWRDLPLWGVDVREKYNCKPYIFL
jgi:hypothetical protein